MSSELDRLLNQTEDQRQAAQKAESTRANAHTLLRDTSSGNLRPLTPSETKYNDPNGRMGVGFQHKSGNLVFLSTDPAKGEIHASVLSGTGPDRPNGAGFTITADGGLKPGSVSGLKNTSDLGDKTLTNDVVRHTDNSFKLSANAGSFSEKIDARWSQAQAGNRMAADVVAGIAADQPGITAPKAVEIGNALTGADPSTAIKADHALLTTSEGEREMARLLNQAPLHETSGVKGKGNIATNVAIGGAVALATLANGANAAEALEAGADAVNPYAQTMHTAINKNATGLDTAAKASEDTARLAGGTAGAVLGAQAGATVGAVAGPVGAAVGGTVGAVVGGIAGDVAVQKAIEHGQEAYNAAVDATSRGIEAVSNAGGKAWDYMFGENKSEVSAAAKPSQASAPSPSPASRSGSATSFASDIDGQTVKGGNGLSAQTAFNDNAAGKPSTSPTPEVATPAPEAKTEEKYTVKPPTPAPAPV
ncbi:MAG TPA: hypothetical protein PKX87_07265 [Alphaproteobacteria bacterium]|nr:hypothetical protein [Alphaproteobacteria bacterium]